MLLLTASCKKTLFNTRVEGVLVDSATGQPLPGINAYFIHRKVNSSGTVTSTYETDPVRTGDKGIFRFTYHGDRDDRYYVTARDKDIFDDGLAVMEVDSRRRNKVTLRANAKAYLAILVNNTAPSSSADDSITIDWTRNIPGPIVMSRSESGYLQNPGGDIYFAVYGNRETRITWRVTRNNVTTEQSTTIYCKAFTSNSIAINY